MNKPIKTIAVALAAIAAISVQQTEACTRATYIGPDNTVITGRTMDWKEDLMSNILCIPKRHAKGRLQQREYSELDFQVR